MSSSTGSFSTRKLSIVRWLVSIGILGVSLAITATAWGSSGPSGFLAQAAQGTCPCPGGGAILTGTAGYAIRWLLIIALFVASAIAAFALGRSRKRAEQA